MIREDRELLVELARLNRDLAFLGMCIMDGSVTAAEDGNGVRTTRVWRRLLGVENTVIESVDLEPDGRIGLRVGQRLRVIAQPGKDDRDLFGWCSGPGCVFAGQAPGGVFVGICWAADRVRPG